VSVETILCNVGLKTAKAGWFPCSHSTVKLCSASFDHLNPFGSLFGMHYNSGKPGVNYNMTYVQGAEALRNACTRDSSGRKVQPKKCRLLCRKRQSLQASSF